MQRIAVAASRWREVASDVALAHTQSGELRGILSNLVRLADIVYLVLAAGARLAAENAPRRVVMPVDLAVTSGVDAAVQFLVDRLKTQQGELTALGHPEYGSRHHELIGQPNVGKLRWCSSI